MWHSPTDYIAGLAETVYPCRKCWERTNMEGRDMRGTARKERRERRREEKGAGRKEKTGERIFGFRT